MYDLIDNIIQHTWETANYSSSEQQILYYISGSIIVILIVTFIDLIYRTFSNFWKRA